MQIVDDFGLIQARKVFLIRILRYLNKKRLGVLMF